MNKLYYGFEYVFAIGLVLLIVYHSIKWVWKEAFSHYEPRTKSIIIISGIIFVIFLIFFK